MARDFNRLSLAVLTAMAKRRPLRLTLTGDREVEGVPVASAIDRDLARRKLPSRTVTFAGHEPFPILEVEAARWA